MTEKKTEVAPDQIEVTAEEINYFKQMFAVNVNDKLDQKNGLSYLSWAWAWAETKKIDPRAKQVVHYFPYEGNHDIKVPYLKTPNGFFVQVSVTIHGHTETEMLPVLDHRNKPIANPNAFEINKNQKRCLVKAIALHGLGLYVYAGEDIPEGAEGAPKTIPEKSNQGSRNNDVEKLKKIVTAKKFALAKQKNCDVKAIDGSLSKRIVGWTSYTNDPSLLEQAKKILEEQGA